MLKHIFLFTFLQCILLIIQPGKPGYQLLEYFFAYQNTSKDQYTFSHTLLTLNSFLVIKIYPLPNNIQGTHHRHLGVILTVTRAESFA